LALVASRYQAANCCETSGFCSQYSLKVSFNSKILYNYQNGNYFLSLLRKYQDFSFIQVSIQNELFSNKFSNLLFYSYFDGLSLFFLIHSNLHNTRIHVFYKN
jgi:hypothetical protein